MNDAPTYCDHCGNLTFKKFEGSYNTSPDSSGAYIIYVLFRCEICNGAIFMKYYQKKRGEVISLSPYVAQPDDLERTEQLWPPSLILPPEAPERVREIYGEARSVMKRSPSSFVVQIGRALEAVTRDRNAEGRTLYERLNWLIRTGLLPQVFGEMGQINRIVRNWGAHDAEIKVEPGDVVIVDEFFKAIIEYLYVAPAKLTSVQNLIQQRQR